MINITTKQITMKNKWLIALLISVPFFFSSGCKKEDDRNSIKIEIDGVVVERGTMQPIPDVYITFTGPLGDYANTKTTEDGSFSHQFFGSETATLTLKKVGYIFEYKKNETDTTQNFRLFDTGTYTDLILEMKKITEE